jgi:ketopantoate reductase
MVSSDVSPAIIVGGSGRVGNALRNMGPEGDVIVKRGDPFPSEPSSGPIFVCTRNDALRGVIEWTPESRREDLVFLQNGYLRGFLDSVGLGNCTQALVYFAVAKFGEAPTDGVTDVNPEGLTAANGKHAAAFAARLKNADLACHVLNDGDFKANMFEKLIWISAFMLVGAAHPGATVGDVESVHRDEVVELIEEMVKGTAETENVNFQSGSVDRLLAYARAVSHFPTAVKEFQWRNGFFYEVSRKAAEAGAPDPFPTHTKLLKSVGAVQ